MRWGKKIKGHMGKFWLRAKIFLVCGRLRMPDSTNEWYLRPTINLRPIIIDLYKL